MNGESIRKLWEKFSTAVYIIVILFGVIAFMMALFVGQATNTSFPESLQNFLLNLASEFISVCFLFFLIQQRLGWNPENEQQKSLSELVKVLVESSAKKADVIDKRNRIESEKIMDVAQQEIWISGITMDNMWDTLSDTIKKRSGERQAKIRVLVVEPHSKAADETTKYLEGEPLNERLEHSLHQLEKLSENKNCTVEIRTMNHRPSVGYLMVDPYAQTGKMTVSPYLYKTRGIRCPMFVLSALINKNEFDTFVTEYEALWNGAKEWSSRTNIGTVDRTDMLAASEKIVIDYELIEEGQRVQSAKK